MKVEAKFILSSDKYDCLDEITERLSLQPTKIQRPEDIRVEEFKSYNWMLHTGEKEGISTIDQMERLVKLLEDKTGTINELVEKYEMTTDLRVVITLEEPVAVLRGLRIPPEISRFAASVQAEISMGVYLA